MEAKNTEDQGSTWAAAPLEGGRETENKNN